MRVWLMMMIIFKSWCEASETAFGDNVTQVISHLLEGYDIRLRPNFGGQPLSIGMDLTIASFDSISEVNMDYTLTLYLNQYWRDERLAFSTHDRVFTLSGEFAQKIWVPDTFFANDKNSYLHDVTEKNVMVRLHGDGSITYGMRFTTTLACMMDLHYYPLDVQNCTVEIESYGYTMLDVVMNWRDTPVIGIEKAQLPQFKIMGYDTTDRVETLATGITTVLTMTTISTGVRSSLPRISYVKAIDIYLVMCFVFVFAALLEYAAVNYTYWGNRAKKKKNTKQGINPTIKSEDILELDICLSPIPSLRRRLNKSTSPYRDPRRDECSPPLPPSFRLVNRRNSSFYAACTNRNFLYGRGKTAVSARRQRIIEHLKKSACKIKSSMPRIKDVNVIDRVSRVFFPVSFIVFNAVYWSYYMF